MNIELVFNGVIMVCLIVLFLMTRQFEGVKISTDYLGPSGFPQAVMVMAMIIIAILSYRLITEKKTENTEDFQKIKKVGLVIVLIFIYIFALNVLGYMVSTFISVYLIGKAIGYRQNLKMVIFALVLTTIMVLVFGNVFTVPLPRGVGFLREFSYLIY